MRKQRACSRNGKVWPSIRAASAEIGHSPDYIRLRCDAKLSGWRWETIPVPEKPNWRKRGPYLIRGKSYATAREAAKAISVSTSAIYRAVDAKRAEIVGLFPKGPKSAIAVTDGEVNYPTLTAAGATIGIRADKLKKMLERGETKFRFLGKER